MVNYLFHRFKNSPVEASVFDYTKCFKAEPVEEQLSGRNQVVHYSIIYGKEINFKKEAHYYF